MNEAQTETTAAMGEVWVFIQHHNNQIMEASLEVLGKGRELASGLKVPAAGVLVGEQVEHLAGDTIAHGADKVYLLQSPFLRHYTTGVYTKALCSAIGAHRPAVFLMAATPRGRDLAPRMASQLRTGLTADCTDLKIGSYTDPKTRQRYGNILLQIRPAWGGNLIATIVTPTNLPQMATIREGMMRLPPRDASARGEIIPLVTDLEPADVCTAVLQQQPAEKTVNLKKANIIIAGGAGLGTKENFQLVYRLARTLGGEVGATRAAVDAGFIGHDHQIGQTGISVRPKLYIACGISGAVQHLAGMEEAGKIIAVNSDPQAPIFSVAHYGIIGDVREVIPRLIRAYRTLSH